MLRSSDLRRRRSYAHQGMRIGRGHPNRHQIAGPGSVAGKDNRFEVRVFARQPVFLLLGRPLNQYLDGPANTLLIDLSPNALLKANNLL